MNNFKKQQIASIVIKVLLKRFETFPIDASNNRNAPFHEAFLHAFQEKFDDRVSDLPLFISLSSWLHGLNTTLWQTFFEKVAHILSQGEKREYTSKKLGNLQIFQSQKDVINQIMTNLSTSQTSPHLRNEVTAIYEISSGALTNAIDFSADVFIEDANSILAIELKSVKPNSGEMKGEKQKILEGKTALQRAFPNKQIDFYIGFPFDPTSPTPCDFDKTRFLNSIINMTKFFDPAETLIASELWDKLSGEEHTMEIILEIINAISTPTFMQNFQFLQNSTNKNDPHYHEILQAWYLFSEIELVERDKEIQQAIHNHRELQKIYHQNLFIDDEYNRNRANQLLHLFSPRDERLMTEN